MKNETPGYAAFISYRHVAHDMAAAKELSSMLENYHIPYSIRKRTGRKNIGRIFRDRDELPLSSDLGEDIHQALKDSEWLIIVCSPDYLESKWCKEELDYFISLGKKNHILTVLVRGTPEASFPSTLLTREIDGKIVSVDPLAANASSDDTKKMLKLLREEKLRLLAPMLNVRYDDLKRRARERKLKIALGITAAGLAAATALACYAVNRAQVIEQARREAAENEVQLLTEKSIGLTQSEERTSARQYALQAYSVSETIDGLHHDEVISALRASCYSADFTRLRTLDNKNLRIYSAVYSPDDSLVAGIANYDTVAVFSTEDGSLLYTVADAYEPLDRVLFSPNGSLLMTVDSGDNAVRIYEASTGKQKCALSDDGSGSMFYLCGAEFLNDDQVILVFQDKVSIFETDGTYAGGYPLDDVLILDTKCFTIDTENERLAIFSSDGTGEVRLIDIYTGECEILSTGLQYGIWSGAFSPDGSILAVNAMKRVALFDTKSGDLLSVSESEELSMCYDMAFSPDGALALSLYAGIISAVDINSGEVVYENTLETSSTGGLIYLIGDGSFFYVEDCPTQIFETRTGSLARDLEGEDYTIVAASNNGKTMILDQGSMTFGVHNMLGNGSVEYYEKYKGELLAPVETGTLDASITLVNPYYDQTDSDYAGIYPENLLVSPNGRYAVLINQGSYIKVWDLKVSNEVLYRLYENSYYGQTMTPDLVFSSNGTRFAATCYSGRALVYDLTTGTTVRVFAPCEWRATLDEIHFNEDASLVMMATETTGEYFVYRVEDGTLLYHLYADKEVSDFGFDEESGDAVILYSDGSARTARLFTDETELLEYADLLESENKGGNIWDILRLKK